MSEYFDYSTGRLASGGTARAAAVNAILDLISAGFDKLPSEARTKRETINYGTESGAANAYVVTLTYTPTSLTDGMVVIFKAGNTNTSATVTLNVNSLGAKSVTYQDGTALEIGDIVEDKFTTLRYNSTTDTFEVVGITPALIACIAGVQAATSGSGVLVSSNDTTIGYLNGKLLGTANDITLTEGNDGGDETLTISIDTTDDLSFFNAMAF